MLWSKQYGRLTRFVQDRWTFLSVQRGTLNKNITLPGAIQTAQILMSFRHPHQQTTAFTSSKIGVVLGKASNPIRCSHYSSEDFFVPSLWREDCGCGAVTQPRHQDALQMFWSKQKLSSEKNRYSLHTYRRCGSTPKHILLASPQGPFSMETRMNVDTNNGHKETASGRQGCKTNLLQRNGCIYPQVL